MSKKKIIGSKYLTYNEKRNIALPFPDYEVKRIIDLYVLLSAAYLRLKGKPNSKWINLHKDFDLNNCAGYHFWNATSFSKKPWVTTLELPCCEPLRLEHLSRSQCKKIFCLSSWVMDYQTQLVESSPYRDDILPKLELLHPPQNPNTTELDLISKNFDGTLKFLFVGRDFFRKGGYECVKAFSRIIELGLDAELTIVSQLTTNDYPVPAPQANLEHALKLIEDSQGKIKVFPEISQKEVFNLMATSHIGLLPTYNDSYGYSVLEFFSYGCPVITTNILALPEINHPDRGWIIDMPLVDNGDGLPLIDRTSPDLRLAMSNVLTELLLDIIISILQDEQHLKSKSIAALKYVEKNHDVCKNIKILEDVYHTF
ncbi:glycosyltransferase family 4 protein [Chamaesiphon minutus]|uniref:Glycosyltransferase n=1 Tax=Chamaesiphon minutus (strain ATCC 27169 / PCC 6605) TaxID=1173020 RepID=K9UN18_CHAP6|nr:glycosyltransferase family 4 protein [Chamaesiphon minutus]AFY95594.1 glycosyltransferase [Chamaesiphon minutus PCC 6605]